MLRELLGRVGRDCYIEAPFNVDYGCNISIGNNFYANSKYVFSSCRAIYLPIFSRSPFNLPTYILTLCSMTCYSNNIFRAKRCYKKNSVTILDCGLVTIGHRVMFGPNVSIFGGTHETEVQSRRDYIEYAREVTIGNDCWIGGNTVILPGVTIGKGCTVGAGSVVTTDIPPFSVAVGSPAKVVKKVTPVPDLEE